MDAAKTVPIRNSSAEMQKRCNRLLEQSGEAIIVQGHGRGGDVLETRGIDLVRLYGRGSDRPSAARLACRRSVGRGLRSPPRPRPRRQADGVDQRATKKSGETVRVSIKTTPLIDAQGRVIGEITLARDNHAPAPHRGGAAQRAGDARGEGGGDRRIESKLDGNRAAARGLSPQWRSAVAHGRAAAGLRGAQRRPTQ